jgi:hypothetical protein
MCGLLLQSGEAVGLDMEELQHLRASVAAATWNQQAAALLTTVSSVKTVTASPVQQQASGSEPSSAHAAQQPQLQPLESQPAVSAARHAEPTADRAAADGSSPLAGAVAQQEAVTANGMGSAAEHHQLHQQSTSDQVSLWHRIAAAEAAAAEAAERAEVQSPRSCKGLSHFSGSAPKALFCQREPFHKTATNACLAGDAQCQTC